MAEATHEATVQWVGDPVEVRQIGVQAQLHQFAYSALSAQVDQLIGWRLDDGFLVATLTGQITVTDPNAGALVFAAEVVFASIYPVLDKEAATEEVVVEFVGSVGASSMHPYLRESFQTLTIRAGLPAYVLPTSQGPIPVGQLPESDDDGQG
jgi:preprotein translocase subunit SecB